VIVRGDKSVDLVADLAWRGEAGAGQGFGGKNGKPDFDPVQPGGMRRGEMKPDVLVAAEPAIVFGFVGVEVVQDDVNFPVRMLGDDAVHKVRELDAPAAAVVAGFDQAGGHLERGEQGCGAVALVFMVEPRHRLAIGQLQPTLSPLQGPDVRFLVDRKHQGVLRRLQVQRDNVGGLLREGRIGADASTAPPRQRDLVPAQNPPDLVFGNVAQMFGQEAAVPASVTQRRRPIQRRQDPSLMGALVMPWLAAARRARETRQTGLRKAPRHLLTVAGRVRSRSATAALLRPSPSARTTCARNARRRSVLPAASQAAKVARSSSVNATSVAFIPATYHIR
jgi:hypothetical protein